MDVSKIVLNEQWGVLTVIMKNLKMYKIYKIDECGNSLLHYLIYKNKLDYARELMKLGFKLDVPNNSGETSLHCAVKWNKLSAAKMLISYGANINAEDKNGWTPIVHAVTRGFVKLAQFIVKKSVQFDYVCEEDNSLLHYSVILNIDTIITDLITGGVDANLKNSFGKTALRIAIEMGNEKIVTILMQCTTNDDMLLHYAVYAEDKSMIKLLLKHFPIDSQDSDGQTPLHIAIAQQNLEIVKLLLAKNADVNCHDNDQYAPLHLASRLNDVRFLSLLLKNGANVESKTFNGDTCLHVAASCNNFPAFSVLLKNGAANYANNANNNGQTALHYAAESGAIEIVDCLLKLRVQTDAIDQFNRTPECYARQKLNLRKLLNKRQKETSNLSIKNELLNSDIF